jgi:beta-galactosidase
MFRIPKYAAGFYRSQCDPAEEIVLEPAFPWCMGDYPGGGIGEPIVHSNCDRLELFLDEEYVGEILPEREAFPGLAHPPFFVRLPVSQIWGSKWRSLRIDGFVGSRKAISKTLSDKGVDSDFILAADDTGLLGDGRDMTRVWFRVTDEFGNPRNFAVGVIWFDIEGPGEIIGDNPFALIGGCGAIWIRSKPEMGIIWLTATHPTLGKRKIWLLVQGPRTEKV